MPPSLRALAELSFTAQQSLAFGLKECIEKKLLATTERDILVRHEKDGSLPSHYNQYKSGPYLEDPCDFRGFDGHVTLNGAWDLADPISDLDRLHRASDGIWYPDCWKPRMAWSRGPSPGDSFGFEFDPFRISRNVSGSCFTEQLDHAIAHQPHPLQCIMKQDGSRSLERGNYPIALQSEKLDWLAKHEYLTLGKARAFPLSQIRCLLVGLAEDALRFESSVTHKLASEALYHIGRIGPSESEADIFPWKFDIYNGDCVAIARALFSDVADVLCESPTKYSQTPLLADLSLFLSAWDDKTELRAIPRCLAEASLGVRVPASDSLPKACLYYRYAIVCCGSGRSFSPDDVEAIITLSVLCQNLYSIPAEHSNKTEHLAAWCTAILCSHLGQLVAGARQDPDCLTRAVKRLISHCPHNLKWTPLSYTHARFCPCFQASSNSDVYAVDVLSGLVLVNGRPIATLPLEIRSTKLCRKVFGNADFDVVYKARASETTAPVSGKRYKFMLSNRLFVKEVDDKEGFELELVDPFAIESWRSELPSRLKNMHSHWMSKSRGGSVILLRGQRYTERAISFVVTLETESSGSSREVSVALVPQERQMDTSPLDLERESDGLDQLVLFRPLLEAVKTLSKFERFWNSYMRIWATTELFASSYQSFACPFEHHVWKLVVRELKGFYLAPSQLEQGAIRGFQRYLVALQSSQGTDAVYLIVPEGDVQRQDDDTVTIQCSEACDATILFHKSSRHHRYNVFQANSRLARLRLVALHAATSMKLPDPLFRMSGMEHALELLRQCWTSAPLPSDEKSALENVASVSIGRHCALRLACSAMWRSSEQVSLLYHGLWEDSFRPEVPALSENCDDASFYQLKVDGNRCNGRMRLTGGEAACCNNGNRALMSSPALDAASINLWDCNASLERLSQLEDELAALVEIEDDAASLRDSPVSNLQDPG